MPLLIILIPSLQFILWLAAIRPYCIRHRLGHTTGANWGVTMWVDWQQAGESAKECGDRGMIRVCRAFLVLQILFVLGVGWLVLRPS